MQSGLSKVSLYVGDRDENEALDQDSTAQEVQK